jgi:hypothetical protein
VALIKSDDPDFRVLRVDFETLVQIQLEAESHGWGTRWSSVAALRGQVKEAEVLLQSIMRQERDGAVRAYRCFVLFSTVDGNTAGGLSTIDVEPTRFESLPRLDRDPDVRKAFARMFALATGGISMGSKP